VETLVQIYPQTPSNVSLAMNIVGRFYPAKQCLAFLETGGNILPAEVQ
jgi:hypothetical protein